MLISRLGVLNAPPQPCAHPSALGSAAAVGPSGGSGGCLVGVGVSGGCSVGGDSAEVGAGKQILGEIFLNRF